MRRVFLTSLIIGLLAGSVFAQHPGIQGMAFRDYGQRGDAPWMGKDHGKHSGDMHRAMMGIDLNEKQEKTIAKLKREHKIKLIELKSQMAGLHAKGKLLIVDDNVKDSDIKAFATKISSYSGKMFVLRMSHARDVRALLTDEQRLTFDNNVLSQGPPKHKKMKHMQNRRRGMRGRHMGGD